MFVTIVHVRVKSTSIEDFIEVTMLNHNESVKEQGNLRFDVLQDEKVPQKFIIYEAYETEEAIKAHKSTDHYKVWRNTVEHMMAEPREGIRYKILAPSNTSLWK